MEFLENFNGIKFLGKRRVYNGYLKQRAILERISTVGRNKYILMKETNNVLPDWFDGTVYNEGDTITNPFSGESFDLDAAETSMYDLIMGINYVGDHRGWDDEMINLHQKALEWFRTTNSKAYMVLLD
jgi:hypothetical protein